ncbi:MAG: hypothetical protein JWP50_2702 [Phenylobacterium sp.]|nr:hypothetical protein [Phenylobacterium sp.]
MAQISEPRARPWIAFLAGAVVMLLLVLVWLAWTRSQEAISTVASGVTLPRTAALPSLPTAPPPEGPHLPRPPAPTPR